MTIAQARTYIANHDALSAEKAELQQILGTQSSADVTVFNADNVAKTIRTSNSTLIASVQTAIASRISEINSAIADIESQFT